MKYLYGGLVSVYAMIGLFATSPTSTNFTLKSFDFGTGGDSLTSTNYGVSGISGTQSGDSQSSTNFYINSGLNPTQEAFVPPAPSFTNPSSEYNRLRLIINTGGSPSDTRFAVGISKDNFVTTLWAQTDNTIGPAFSIANYQTYAGWGSGSGVWLTGLESNTTYKVKAKAYQGNFTNTKFGPEVSVATVLPSLTFSLETTLSISPPFNMSFGGLIPGTVTNANADVLIGLSSNALFGGNVFIKDANSGLSSTKASYTISSATADLAAANTGYGGLVTSASQTSGGPFISVAPFNGVADNVGALNSSLQYILSTTSPVTGGSATVRFKAKASSIVPGADDFADTLTFVAAMKF